MLFCGVATRMTIDLILRLLADLCWTGLKVCAPVLGLTLAVGLLISVLQVVTQVQEMSLTFIPKLIVAVLTLLGFGAWMLRQLAGFAIRIWTQIPSLF